MNSISATMQGLRGEQQGQSGAGTASSLVRFVLLNQG